MKISGIYKITNTATGDFYIGSSKDVKRRWIEHKCQSRWKNYPNNQMYMDMQKFGVNNFVFEVLAEVEESFLKEKEQEFIETLNPTYNQMNAKGLNTERYKETKKEYRKSNKFKKYQEEYQKTDKGKKSKKEYEKTERYKETHRKSSNKYDNQLCIYNGETLTLCALSTRFRRAGIPHSTVEAKKYLL